MVCAGDLPQAQNFHASSEGANPYTHQVESIGRRRAAIVAAVPFQDVLSGREIGFTNPSHDAAREIVYDHVRFTSAKEDEAERNRPA